MTAALTPVPMQWDGEAFRPVSRTWAKRSDEQFTVGEVYKILPIEDRSAASHRAYFAALNDAWQNLPDEMTERFPTVDHLRRYALIKTGFCDERSVVCSTKAEAERIAAFVRAMNGYGVVLLRDKTVTAYEAKSQSYRAMGAADFQRSKSAVLEYIASLIGVTVKELQRNAETVA